MIDLFDVALELQKFLTQQHWRFCFIGGLAIQRWGEPRVTQDVDCTLLTGFGGEEAYVQALLGRYAGRVPDAAQFALQNRVLLLCSESGIGIDVALGGLEYEVAVVSRATYRRTCSAEDLVILKAFADRRRGWADIEGIVDRQVGRLDWPYIYNQLGPLSELKENPAIVTTLKSLQHAMES